MAAAFDQSGGQYHHSVSIKPDIRIVDILSNVLKHIMFLFGLAKEAAPYFLVADVIGLIYGAGILIVKEGCYEGKVL